MSGIFWSQIFFNFTQQKNGSRIYTHFELGRMEIDAPKVVQYL